MDERALFALLFELADALEVVTVVTARSRAGTYLATTRSGSLYAIDIVDSTVAPVVTAYSPSDDKVQLRGVRRLLFDATTGECRVDWDEPDAHLRDKGAMFAVTPHTTADVTFVARVHDNSSVDKNEIVSKLRAVRSGIAASDPGALVRGVAHRHGFHESDRPDEASATRQREAIEKLIARRFDCIHNEPTSRETSSALSRTEREFLTAAGVPGVAFSRGALRDNDAWLAESVASTKAALRTWMSEEDAAGALGISVLKLLRIAALRGLATDGLDDRVVFAPWQFMPSRGVLPHVRAVLEAFPADYTPLDIEEIMTQPDESLDGQAPRDLLEQGVPIEPLLTWIDDLRRS